ncbi:uncharacterized protein TNCV_656091 [Trichonephila clavipes]|nr:uncharacterized protein TNCV_656091 [Trichonephila clavipes]
MRLQKRKVDGYEWRCRNQSKDNRHNVVRSVRKGTWFSESKLAITIILRLTRYWFGKSMNAFVVNDLKVNKNMTKLIRHVAAILRSQVGLLATDHVILNHGQVTWTTPELAPPLLTTTPHQWKDVSALDRFNVHRCPTRRVFSGTGFEPVTKQATVRYLYHSATAAPGLT